MKEEKRRNHQHEEARKYKEILCIALTSENDPQKCNRTHNSGAYSGRNQTRENHVDNDGKNDHHRGKPARQMQKECQPCDHRRKKADMGAGNREDVHNPGDCKCLKEFGTYPVIATKEHGKNRSGIAARHNLRHAVQIERTHVSCPLQK